MPPNPLVAPAGDSALALALIRLEGGHRGEILDTESDSLIYGVAGTGSLDVGGSRTALAPRTAALALAGEAAVLEADADGLDVLHATVGARADRHAPLGPRETSVSLATADSERATGARSFQVLFGPHNGSTRATLFAGFIPPGRAPWHYHLYDEIVWVPEGPGRLHLGEEVTELGPGSAFRLRPREVHTVENTSSDRELTIIGIFTPAGSPSAAYLTPEIAAEYRFSE